MPTTTLPNLFLILILSRTTFAAPLPEEPVEIGTEAQFLVDNYLVDNSWALRYKRESLRRVFHQPKKYDGNPIIRGDGGSVCAIKDEKSGKFRMWYQTAIVDPQREEKTQYAVAYAESADGMKWELPKLGLHIWRGDKQNNIVWKGIKGDRASGAFLLEVPEKDRKGHAYLMFYREPAGMHLIGSSDGIRWDPKSAFNLRKLHSDTQNVIVYDPHRKEYVMYCRAKETYRVGRGEIVDTGESRRVARMTSKELWKPWEAEARNILIPDDQDEERGFNCFYGMPCRVYGGVFWGFPWAFKMNTDIHTELAWSRDGIDFERFPGRPKFIERGPEKAWDSGMVFGGSHWVQVGDEWWFYYSGWDGPHESHTRKPGIGLAKMRKEGFVSVHGPQGGGVIVTRTLRWPGGGLRLNAEAKRGEIKVRVSDVRRKVLTGFDYEVCTALKGDGVAQEVRWKEKDIASLAGQVIRLEFLIKDADLYTFRATGVKRASEGK